MARPDKVAATSARCTWRADGNARRRHGLLGLRERVVLYGGELDAGSQPGGGWRVRARLPEQPSLAAAPVPS